MGMKDWVKTATGWVIPDAWRGDVTVIPVVRLSGAIGMISPFSGSLSLANVAAPLAKAFAIKRAPAVALIVNSPGGSPVQSRLIYERIRALAEEADKKVLVFIEDAAASGGYMIACAGDDIIADPSSIVGSIGVVSAGFGFTELIQRLGIERRVYTAGEKKVTLDPFKPEVAEDVAHLKALQADIHETFVELVRERRGSRLKPGEELFDGTFWTGKRGLDLGLVDQLGDILGVLRARYGETVNLKLIPRSRGFFPGREPPGEVSGARGAGLAQALGAVEARGLWARLGL